MPLANFYGFVKGFIPSFLYIPKSATNQPKKGDLNQKSGFLTGTIRQTML